jgi:hypothetical protein
VDAETQVTRQGAGLSLPFPTVQSLAGPVSFFLGVMAIAFMFAMDFLTNDLSSLPFVRDLGEKSWAAGGSARRNC